jgi:two-component system, sensor histidine kinase and response regulator
MAKILIVDDDAHLRETLRDLLEMEKFNVDEAATAAEALQKVMTGFYEVILTDFNLPDKTGIEVIREIRKVNTESEILMMTAHASLETAVKAIQESVYDFLIKPVDFNYLKRAIGNALDKFRLRDENRRLIDQLKKSNEQLLAFNNMKSKFLSMASHDLSNALMTLQVSFDLMAPQLAGADVEQRKRVKYITDSIGQISRLVEDLVDWASIEKGKFRLERADFDLSEMLESLLTGMRQRAAAKQIQILSKIEGGLPPVSADRRRLSQVLSNLLENAIRHTPRGGVIEVQVARSGEFVELGVNDNGDGIEAPELEKIFQSFYQSAGGQGGRLGLGLSISKEIVHSHGGKIWVESKGKGKGASFRFTVPLGAPVAAKS